MDGFELEEDHEKGRAHPAMAPRNISPWTIRPGIASAPEARKASRAAAAKQATRVPVMHPDPVMTPSWKR